MNAHAVRIVPARAGARQLPELLQTLLTAELIAPGVCLWLVTERLGDPAVVDNRTNGFAALEPLWPRGHVRLSQVLAALLRQGTTIHVASLPGEATQEFARAVRQSAGSMVARFQLHEARDLGTPGLLSEGYYLSGSLGLSGALGAGGSVALVTDPAELARFRVQFTERWGAA